LTACVRVEHTPGQVYAFLADLENHRRLQDRSLRVQQLDADDHGGQIAIRTPLGFRRTAHTTLTAKNQPGQIVGIAQIGRRTTFRVTWTIEPHGDGATVELTGVILTASRFDALQLTLGGRWWLKRRLHRVMERLTVVLPTDRPRPRPESPTSYGETVVNG
jgi:Polyketide cyclase / dehydrase and lipid transport